MDDDGSKKLIPSAPQVLTNPERNYSQFEKEGLSVIFAVKKFYQGSFT